MEPRSCKNCRISGACKISTVDSRKKFEIAVETSEMFVDSENLILGTYRLIAGYCRFWEKKRD